MMNKLLTTLLFFCQIACLSQTQVATPTSSGINTSVGSITWNNTNNIFTSDNSKALSDNLNNGDITYYLTATNFGFTIPTGASIDGIQVSIERDDNSGVGGIKDNSVKLIKNGVISGNDLAAGATWPNSDAVKTYGNATNIWGLTWTESDINSSNFGIAVSAQRTSGGGTNNASIDNISITIYYTDLLPITLLDFNANLSNDVINIKWITATEINNDYFVVHKSIDGFNWFGLAKIKGAGNSSTSLTYGCVDTNLNIGYNYYRLAQIDFDGKTTIFQAISVQYLVNTKNIVKIMNYMGQEITKNYNGLKIIIYDDGTYLKTFQNIW